MPPSDSTISSLAEVERRFLRATIQGGAFARRGGPLPEIEHSLLRALAPLIPEKRAVDIGAYQGAYTDLFLTLGFHVTACEPVPTLMRDLKDRLGGEQRVTFVRAALGREDGQAELSLASLSHAALQGTDPNLFNTLISHPTADLISFSRSVRTPLRTLRNLVESGLIEAPIGVLKIDTEGGDCDVLHGATPHLGRVTLCEFWNESYVFAGGDARNDVPHLRATLAQLGYGYRLLVLGRDEAQRRLFFQLDPPASLPGSWGNVLITKDEAILAAAVEWCLDVMGPDGIEI